MQNNFETNEQRVKGKKKNQSATDQCDGATESCPLHKEKNINFLDWYPIGLLERSQLR